VLFAAKPHPGPDARGRAPARRPAQRPSRRATSKRLQDPLLAALRAARDRRAGRCPAVPAPVHRERLNSANDNPLVDPDREQILHGGHFYGGHIAFAMDSLKNCGRQPGRPARPPAGAAGGHAASTTACRPNLSGASGPRAAINHGLKALQISVSAWTAEALKLTMPASVFSRSTECHNQDKVSMGTIAARDCLRVLELTEQVGAAMLIAARQGVTLRGRIAPETKVEGEPAAMLADLDERIALVEEDRALDHDLRALLDDVRVRRWSLYAQ
jgi:histidine ammonia-lyase